MKVGAPVNGVTFLLRPLDSARPGIGSLRASWSLWELLWPLLLSPVMPGYGIFSRCYHFSPLPGSDISLRSAPLFSIDLQFILYSFSSHHFILLLWCSASSFFPYCLLCSLFPPVVPALELNAVNQIAIMWANSLSLCC